MLLEVKNCIKRDSKNKLWSKIEKNNHTKTFRQLVLVSYEICQIHSLDCASDLSQDKILFIYNMRLRPKYGKYLSQFQNFRPSFRSTFVHWLFLKVGIHEGTSRGDMSPGTCCLLKSNEWHVAGTGPLLMSHEAMQYAGHMSLWVENWHDKQRVIAEKRCLSFGKKCCLSYIWLVSFAVHTKG